MIGGFIDSIAGGGGLITVPALMMTGMPPVNALATNKFQGSFGTLTASLTFWRKGVISVREMWFPFLLSFIGSVIGVWVLQHIDSAILEQLIPWLLVLMALYFWLSPSIGDKDRQARIGDRAYTATAVPAIGFYDGFFGPGAGSFFTLAGVELRGLSLIKATGQTKALNFASNLGGLVAFLVAGQIVFAVGAVMIVGQIIGAGLGARVAIKGGAKIIRPMVVIACLIMAIKLLFF